MVIAIASILVAVGMKTYANFQKWAMWIGLAGVIVCGILLLVTSGDSLQGEVQRGRRQVLRRRRGLLNLQKYETDEAGHFVYDESGNLVVVEGETYAGAFEAVEAVGSGTGMPTSTFSGGLSWATWTLIPFMMFWMAWPNWGATLYGEVRGAKDFRKNIYQMLGGLLVPTAIALAFLGLMTWKVGYQAFMGMMARAVFCVGDISADRRRLHLADGDDLLDRAQRGVPGHPHRRHLAAALRLVRHALPLVDAHDLRLGVRPHPA